MAFEDKFYVIFHGAWAFVDNGKKEPNQIHIYAAHVKDSHHKYLGGTFLLESDISQKTLTLQGVAPNIDGDDYIRFHPNGFILFPLHTPNSALSWATVNLPRPQNIYSELLAGPLGYTVDGMPNTGNIGLVEVFEYQMPEKGAPSLVLPDGQTFWSDRSASGPTTLHFYATEDVAVANPPSDFADVGQIFGFTATIEDFHYDSSQPVNTPGLRGTPREIEIRQLLYQRNQTGASPMFDTSSCGGGGGGS